MKVYVVTCSDSSDEVCEIVGVFESKNAADAAADKHKYPPPGEHQWKSVIVTEHEVIG